VKFKYQKKILKYQSKQTHTIAGHTYSPSQRLSVHSTGEKDNEVHIYDETTQTTACVLNHSDEINKIITYFQADSDQVTFEGPEVITWEPGEREAAVKIWNELACTTCHTIGFTNDPAQAPALKYAKARLRGTWIEKWITTPTDILPYTSMPNFWDGGNTAAVEGVLDNDPKRQIRAIRKYVQEMGYDSYPAPYPKN
jgi:hypothetical protein